MLRINAMCRPQFTLRALLVLMLAVAAFFGGMALQKQLDRPVPIWKATTKVWCGVYDETIEIDGQRWARLVDPDEPANTLNAPQQAPR